MIEDNLKNILTELPSEVKLVAVSKYHPFEEILQAYQAGQRRFGENRPQEFQAKAVQLPQDIEWHFIGHLQTNKLKMVLPYASLVESIDSRHLLNQVDQWGRQHGKVISVLLELHLGAEETKGGFCEEEIVSVLSEYSESLSSESGCLFPNIRFCGLMGMASHTDDEDVIDADFARIESLMQRLQVEFPVLEDFRELSIGMSDDWPIAVRHGATLIRIGTAIFGPRVY